MAENRRFPVLVGRQPQTKLLTPALVQAEDGASGSTVLLRGEAGVGKSTLAAWVPWPPTTTSVATSTSAQQPPQPSSSGCVHDRPDKS
ncbi:hypothetical protein ACFU9X_39355 [Streptomyces atratus]|uniref:hypothetical protein n=1 Tax=Streptomyces atratus TaxID=1893 RepID=UPI0036C6A679